MTPAIYSMGEYCLAEEYSHFTVTPTQWSEMSVIQRKALAKKVFQAELVIKQHCSTSLSVPYTAIKEIVNVPFYTLKQIWDTAEFILKNYKIQNLIGGNFCVPDIDFAFTVLCKTDVLKCTYQQYGKTDGLCPHVVAVAEQNGTLESLVSRYY